MSGPDRPTAIALIPAEIRSGIDRVRWAESLIRCLPEDHDGRNAWLANFGTGPERQEVVTDRFWMQPRSVREREVAPHQPPAASGPRRENPQA